MAEIALVETQFDNGQWLLGRLSAAGIEVREACWLKPVNDDRWSLYVVTPLVDELGSLDAYRRVLHELRARKDDFLTSSELRLVGETQKLARDLIRTARQWPHRLRVSFPEESVGNLLIDAAYRLQPNTVEIVVYGMRFRGDPTAACHLSFEPHNPQSTLVIEKNGKNVEYPAEVGIDWTISAPQGTKLERNRLGLMVLVWDFRGERKQSDADEVLSLAELELQGFRIVRDPGGVEPK